MSYLNRTYSKLGGEPVEAGKGVHGVFYIQRVTHERVEECLNGNLEWTGWKTFHEKVQPKDRIQEAATTHLSYLLLRAGKKIGLVPEWISPIDIRGDYMVAKTERTIQKEVFDGASIKNHWESSERKGFYEIYEALFDPNDIDTHCDTYEIDERDRNSLHRYIEFERYMITMMESVGIKTWDLSPKNMLLDDQAAESFDRFLDGNEPFRPDMIKGKICPNIDTFGWTTENERFLELVKNGEWKK